MRPPLLAGFIVLIFAGLTSCAAPAAAPTPTAIDAAAPPASTPLSAAGMPKRPFPQHSVYADFMLEHLRAYAAASDDAEWMRVADTAYAIIADIQRDHSHTTGLLPDFIQRVRHATSDLRLAT